MSDLHVSGLRDGVHRQVPINDLLGQAMEREYSAGSTRRLDDLAISEKRFRRQADWQGDVKLTASDGQSSSWFGWSVSISDDGSTIAVAARHDNVGGDETGSAYVFATDEHCNWIEQAKLIHDNGNRLGWFGQSLSISDDGSKVLVGASGHGDDDHQSGRAYVFSRDANWTQPSELAAEDGSSFDWFGASLSISGDGNIITVGAPGRDEDGTGVPGHDNQSKNSGAAYVFVGDGGNWTETAMLTHADGVQGDHFGVSVDVSYDGSTIAVGAVGHDAGGRNSGSVYVFVADGDEGWTERAKLTHADGADSDLFGRSLSISDDGRVIVVGAKEDGDGTGSAYVFVADGNGGWTENAKLISSDGAEGDHFGEVVSISDDSSTIVVTAHRDDDHGCESGSAYVFVANGKGGWAEQAKMIPANGTENDYFGKSASISEDGKTIVVGAHWDDSNGRDAGSAFVFTADDDGVHRDTRTTTRTACYAGLTSVTDVGLLVGVICAAVAGIGCLISGWLYRRCKGLHVREKGPIPPTTYKETEDADARGPLSTAELGLALLMSKRYK
eukprot:Clim_evm13s245 gene=Clim_evmTU13s245